MPPWSFSFITQLLFHTFGKQSLEGVSAARKEANTPFSLPSHPDQIFLPHMGSSAEEVTP